MLLASGQRLQARAIVVACGLEANALLAENWLRPKKGQLAITDRYRPRVQHQLVELGYGASAGTKWRARSSICASRGRSNSRSRLSN